MEGGKGGEGEEEGRAGSILEGRGSESLREISTLDRITSRIYLNFFFSFNSWYLKLLETVDSKREMTFIFSLCDFGAIQTENSCDSVY